MTADSPAFILLFKFGAFWPTAAEIAFLDSRDTGEQGVFRARGRARDPAGASVRRHRRGQGALGAARDLHPPSCFSVPHARERDAA
jgi:hypothetical protein